MNHMNIPFLIFQIPGVVKKFRNIKERTIFNKVEFSKLNFREKGQKIEKIIAERKIRPTSPNFINTVTKKLWAREWLTIENSSKTSLYVNICVE